MTAPDALSLSEGAVFHDQYQVVRRIDSGAMGTVYEVIDRRTRRRRALKVMLARFADNTEVTERFRREATITADIVSEHVVETYDAGVDRSTGLPFLVMELLRGEDLGKVVARGPLPAAEIVTLLMQCASALDKMHASAIVHRDLKPENLFITRRDDGAPRLKVLDFGIAKVIEKAAPSATSTRNMGTPVYMSPEQVMGSGNVGPAADLYAVGHLAYAMLTGEAYWLEDALAFETVYPLLLRIMDGATESASARAARHKHITLPPGFDAWFAKATAHDPDHRFKTATESILALADALDVPRPLLPSWPLDQAVGLAPTLSPPENHDESQPILLVPTPSPTTRQEEAHRTLSPVSTLPDTSPAPPPARPARPRHRALYALGASFFATGVLAAVLFGRPSPSPQSVRTGVAATGTEGPPPSQDAPPATAAPVATITDPLSPSADPSTTAAPEPAPVLAVSAPPSSSASTRPIASARHVAPKKKPPTRPGPATSSKAGSPTSYGDPSRDL